MDGLKVFESVANEIGVSAPPMSPSRHGLGAVLLVVLKILGIKLMLHLGHEGRLGGVEVLPVHTSEEGMPLHITEQGLSDTAFHWPGMLIGFEAWPAKGPPKMSGTVTCHRILHGGRDCQLRECLLFWTAKANLEQGLSCCQRASASHGHGFHEISAP